MATVVRNGKLRVIVYSRDHPPPHVHVVAPKSHAKVLIIGRDGHPELVWNVGLSRRQLAWALAVVDEHRERILSAWSSMHEPP